MGKLTFSFSLICIAIILLSALPMHGMEHENKHEQLFLQAEDFNPIDLLTKLPDEALLIETQSLENGIKILMKLSILCKDFNQIWTCEKIGNLCKKYSDDDKIEMAGKIFYRSWYYQRAPLSILIHAGLDVNLGFAPNFLLERAVSNNDMQFIELLFKHKANPNIKEEGKSPVFFGIKTIDMAKLFIKNGVDLNAPGDREAPNVLWHTVIYEGYPSDLMKFYLELQVDTRKLNHRKQCLLHALADYFCTITNVDDYFKKSELLLDVIPDMINLMHCRSGTPMTLWMEGSSKNDSKRFIALFRERKGLTTEEVWEAKYSGKPNQIVEDIIKRWEKLD